MIVMLSRSNYLYIWTSFPQHHRIGFTTHKNHENYTHNEKLKNIHIFGFSVLLLHFYSFIE